MAQHEYLGMDDVRSHLRGTILLLMLKGAGYAAVVSAAVIFFVLAFYWIGQLLPEDSKFAPDPTPLSMEMPAHEADTHAIL